MDTDSVKLAFKWSESAYVGHDLFGNKKADFNARLAMVMNDLDKNGVLPALSAFFRGSGNTDASSLKRLVLDRLLGSEYAISDIIAATPPPLPQRQTGRTSQIEIQGNSLP